MAATTNRAARGDLIARSRVEVERDLGGSDVGRFGDQGGYNNYLSGQLRRQKNQGPNQPLRSEMLGVYLDRLFSPKQKELVFKRRDGIAFTKTEREYYSRIVRKKLEAIASEEVGRIAKKLMLKTGKGQSS